MSDGIMAVPLTDIQVNASPILAHSTNGLILIVTRDHIKQKRNYLWKEPLLFW